MKSNLEEKYAIILKWFFKSNQDKPNRFNLDYTETIIKSDENFFGLVINKKLRLPA